MRTILTGSVGVTLMLGILGFGGCADNAQTGALLGGAVGAGAGQAIGHNTAGTLIGAAAGAGAGYAIGNEQDKARSAAAQSPPPAVVLRQPPQSVAVTQPPPAMVVEQPPVCPAPGYMWIAGYWVWDGARYVWQPGCWAVPPQPGVVWYPPVYEQVGSGFCYRAGYWGRGHWR